MGGSRGLRADAISRDERLCNPPKGQLTPNVVNVGSSRKLHVNTTTVQNEASSVVRSFVAAFVSCRRLGCLFLEFRGCYCLSSKQRRWRRCWLQGQVRSLCVYNCASSNITSRLEPATALSKSVSLGPADTLKLQLTTVDGKKAARPHQAFLTLTDPTTGVEESFVLNVKESGKGKVDLVCGPT